MATQEPNVYAGLAVVIGGLMHARPRFFAKVMGELLFWVGEDKMLFGTDYAIWEPKWQVEGFVDWDYPGRRVLRLPARARPRPRRRSSASTPRSSTASRCREELQLPGRGRAPRRARDDAQLVEGARRDPRTRASSRRSARSTTPSSTSRSPLSASSGSCAVSADGDVDVRLRLPTPQCAPNFAFLMAADARERSCAGCRRSREVTVVLEDHYTGAEINARGRARRRVRRRLPRRDRGRAGRPARAVPAQGAASRASDGVCEALLAAGGRRRRSPRCASATCPADADARRCRRAARASSGFPAAPTHRRSSSGRRRAGRRAACPLAAARRGSFGVSLETNGGICRSLLRVRYATVRPDEEEVAA